MKWARMTHEENLDFEVQERFSYKIRLIKNLKFTCFYLKGLEQFEKLNYAFRVRAKIIQCNFEDVFEVGELVKINESNKVKFLNFLKKLRKTIFHFIEFC